jgi:hypothetical protein
MLEVEGACARTFCVFASVLFLLVFLVASFELPQDAIFHPLKHHSGVPHCRADGLARKVQLRRPQRTVVVFCFYPPLML